MAPRPNLIQYWHSEQVPGEVRELIDGFAAMNPDMRHLLFDRSGAERFIGERFGAREVKAFRACAVPAMQADYLRYCALSSLGGVWADADLSCLEPLDGLLAEQQRGMLIEARGTGLPGGTDLLVFPAADHPLPRLLLDLSTANIERRVSQRVGLVTGPWNLVALAEIRRRGSIEALRGDLPSPEFEPLLDSIVATAGGPERIEQAFAGVRLAPRRHFARWIRLRHNLRYKKGPDHWTTWRDSGREIFR
jgi:Glycosyltransferase sugar-binding region containing DXD motif